MRFLLPFLLFIVLITSGCTSAFVVAPDALYLRLGQEDGIESIVDKATVNCLADPRINRYFITTAQARPKLTIYKNHIVDQICQLAGGPCQYKGRSMSSAHSAMKITGVEFNAFLENLVKAMAQKEIATADQEILIGLLGPLRSQIVQEDMKLMP